MELQSYSNMPFIPVQGQIMPVQKLLIVLALSAFHSYLRFLKNALRSRQYISDLNCLQLKRSFLC